MRHFNIYITGKLGIFDPAGKASQNALFNLGYTGVESLRIGKFLEIECADETTEGEIEEMCTRLLSNPIIEDFRIEEIVLEPISAATTELGEVNAPSE